ncbi:MAG: vWA domain-containing protein, partial [Vulcanimicrobiaceae bacterium]
RDALRALEAVGLADLARVRTALRLVYCATREESAAFDRAFDAFFLGSHGVRQPHNPVRDSPAPRRPQPSKARKPPAPTAQATDQGADERSALPKRAAAHRQSGAEEWMAMRARFSPREGSAAPPQLDELDDDGVVRAVDRFVRSIELGRARRFSPDPRGTRLDPRRTLRGSLATAGDPLRLHRLGHRRRAPRFVLLLDGSRSMAEHAHLMLAFASALVARSRRANVFLFSTELLEITRSLRRAGRGEGLPHLGKAWGGGTRIGTNVRAFVRDHGERLDDDTLVLIFSDGLDEGEPALLEGALRALRRTTAGVVWLHPHAEKAGFEPSARALRAALPLLDSLVGLRNLASLAELPERMRRLRFR